VCATLDGVRRRLGRPVSPAARSSGGGRAGTGPRPTASDRPLSAGRFRRARVSRVLSARALPDSGHRPDTHRVRGGGPGDACEEPMSVLVVVPTYNERDNLPVLAAQVLAHPGFRMLVVDDASPDGTGAVADGLAAAHPGRLEVMHRSGPRGLGRSYVDGLGRALTMPDVELICQMDADLSHNPEYLPALVRAAETHDLVIGSRYVHGVSVVNWPLHRIFLSAFANRYIRRITGLSP